MDGWIESIGVRVVVVQIRRRRRRRGAPISVECVVMRVRVDGRAEEGEDAEGEAAEVVKREAAEEIDHLIARKPLRVAGDTLTQIGRRRRHPPHRRAAEHHCLLSPVMIRFLDHFRFVLGLVWGRIGPVG